MKDNGKFLFLDTVDADPPKQTAVTASPAADGRCSCCEDSLSDLITIIQENGQDPVTQLSGYLITEDPIYLPEGTDARSIARRVGRDKLLETLIELYIRYCPATSAPSDR